MSGTVQRCAECGSELPPNVPPGLCPRCALSAVLETTPAETPAAPAHVAGERIGRYKLLQKIGEGGMGDVWMAEQSEPIRRKVALKVIKLGMDTKAVIARFEAERQALALMDHPNIAKVLDAGTTERPLASSLSPGGGEGARRAGEGDAPLPSDGRGIKGEGLSAGRPYFVMELVRGVKITDYCDQHKLTTRARLDLFTQVCHAIQHAHQKGIIHRDIKPSNILVTLHDGVPVPKVIDFGIAKATSDQRLTDKTIFTAFEQFMGTPAYMSPEQAEMSGLDIDTRSDIYALGVLLYELLTGKPPFDGKELLAAGIDAMRRTIREVEPAKPSTRLNTLLETDRTEVAKHRQTEPNKLASLLRGDLDWIVMKALEKDRARRYETANGLAADVQRHLQNEPVMAAGPSAAYRMTKFVRRHRTTVAMTAGVLLVLLAGVAVSTWQAVRATRAEGVQRQLRQQAQTEAAKNEQVARFLKAMLGGVNPSIAKGRDTTVLREIVDKAAARADKELKGQPEVESSVCNTLGTVYEKLGLYSQAEAMHRAALATRTNYPGGEHREVAASLALLAYTFEQQGKLTEAEASYREAFAMQKKLLGEHHIDTVRTLASLAELFHSQGKLSDAEKMSREALSMLKKDFKGNREDLAAVLNNLATLLMDQGKLDEAEKMFAEALAVTKEVHDDFHPDTATHLANLGVLFLDQGRFTEAEEILREALAVQKKLLGDEHPQVASSIDNLASVLQKRGKLDEAEALYREALTMKKKLLGSEHPTVAVSLNNLGTLFQDQNKLGEAEAMHREALAMRKKLLGNEHPEVASSLGNLAAVLRMQHRLAEAEALLCEALAIVKKLRGHEHSDVARVLNDLAMIYQLQGKFEQAEPMQREALAMRRKLLGGEHPDLAGSLVALGTLLLEKHELAEAEAVLREAVAIYRKALRSEHADLENALGHLARALEAQASLDEAVTVYRETLELREKLHGHQHPEVAKALNNLAMALKRQGELAEAEALLREAHALNTKLLERNHPHVGIAIGNLGVVLADQRKWVEAEPLLLESVELLRPNEQADFQARRKAIERLSVFYTEWAVEAPGTGKIQKALDWQARLTEFDRSSRRQKEASPGE